MNFLVYIPGNEMVAEGGGRASAVNDHKSKELKYISEKYFVDT